MRTFCVCGHTNYRSLGNAFTVLIFYGKFCCLLQCFSALSTFKKETWIFHVLICFSYSALANNTNLLYHIRSWYDQFELLVYVVLLIIAVLEMYLQYSYFMENFDIYPCRFFGGSTVTHRSGLCSSSSEFFVEASYVP